ncbi:hypothetical protein ACJX0J_026647, partial [Zea mays]
YYRTINMKIFFYIFSIASYRRKYGLGINSYALKTDSLMISDVAIEGVLSTQLEHKKHPLKFCILYDADDGIAMGQRIAELYISSPSDHYFTFEYSRYTTTH